jgi:N-acetylglucosaminyldiphosphoundecaprenol N-acetyl-beta-D-mannosaminyltransferase
MNEKVKILGINFNTASKEEILEDVIMGLNGQGGKAIIMTPNPELLVIASGSSEYKKTLNSANFSLPDGVGVVLAAKFLGKNISGRITGVDFMKSLCEKVSKQPVMIGLFGAQPGIAEKTSNCLREMYPSLQISYASHLPPSFKKGSPQIDILFVALGSPKQERWIAENISSLPVKVIMGVGGSFDMISGKTKRAPNILQRIGLEWLWRLVLQPWRVKRQFKLFIFVWLVIKAKFNSSK